MIGHKEEGFEILPYTVYGESMGQGLWKYADLSGRWLKECREIWRCDSERIDLTLPGALGHIRLKITEAALAALVNYYAHGQLASSLLLLSGSSQDAECEIGEMFIASMNRSAPKGGTLQNGFASLLKVGERPLMAVVPVPDASISLEDHELIREHGLHLAGAFFRWKRL